MTPLALLVTIENQHVWVNPEHVSMLVEARFGSAKSGVPAVTLWLQGQPTLQLLGTPEEVIATLEEATS